MDGGDDGDGRDDGDDDDSVCDAGLEPKAFGCLAGSLLLGSLPPQPTPSSPSSLN